jgi:hypothetical protein
LNLKITVKIFPKEVELDRDFEESDSEDIPERVFLVDESFSSTVAKMKAIINCFRKSPLKNNHLQAELEINTFH